MKKTNFKSRRKFFSAMALGATATSLPFLTNPAYAESDQLAEFKFEQADDWFKNIKGKFGAKFMVKRLKNRTKFIKTSSAKSFKDFDKASDFRS